MSLIGIQDSRIENNIIASPVRTTAIVRPSDANNRQSIMLRQSTAVEVNANTLSDPEKRMQPDAVSKTELLGLVGTKDITLDGKQLPDALKQILIP